MIEGGTERKPTDRDIVTEQVGRPAGGGDDTAARAAMFPPPETWPTGRLLSAAARRVERAWDLHLQQWNLSHASLPVLVILSRSSMSQREIAAHMHVTEQSVGRVLRGLQTSGHITREPHPGDRRRHVVALTAAGRQVLETLESAQAAESLIGRSLSPQDTAQLRTLLIRMLADLPRVDERDGT